MSFVFIDKPTLKVITWSLPIYETFRDAAIEASRLNDDRFTVILDRRHGATEFETEWALGTVNELAHDFARHPMPNYGENREGDEP